MLWTDRREGDVIRIGDGVTVTLLKVKGNSVLVGIVAPKGVPIRREEVPPRNVTVVEDDGDAD